MKQKALLTTLAGLFVFLPLLTLAAFVVPGNPTGFMNDFAKILSADQVAALNQKLTDFNATTSIEIAVATVPTLGGDTIESAARQIFDSWKIGKAKLDNGILIVVAPAEHQMRIEVGYGLEGALTDLQSSWIINNQMKPAFRNNDYYGGLDAATTEIISAVKGEAVIPSDSSSADAGTGEPWWSQLLFPLFIFGSFMLQIVGAILGRSKSWWMGGVLGAVVGAVIGLFSGSLSLGVTTIIFLTIFGLGLDYSASKRHEKWVANGSKGSWWITGGGFGGGGHGGGGGGFGGFGGGGSGGGGSSGSW